MRIALIGYGKMGKLIEKIAIDRGHIISNVFNDSQWSSQDISGADVAIEFSTPKSALENIRKSTHAEVSIVVGTTGWYHQWDKVEKWVAEFNVALLPATNFSIGVNIFYEINKKLASLMNHHKSYTSKVKEIHHQQKLDSPSGTAITIAEQIINNIDVYNNWEEGEEENKGTLNIEALRKKDIPGTHQVTYENEIDKISISHEAKNREGFALGAVIAAEFLLDKKGIYSMNDIIKF
ncbi:MAG: 4-hydroxy-tetrahydrodipicolinate reductase [Parvicellaceae bacterium]